MERQPFHPSDEEDEQPVGDEDMEDQQGNVRDENMEDDVGNIEEILNLCTDEDKEDVRRANQEIMKVIRDCGGSRRAYGRERQKAIKAVLSEIYSPPRVTACAKLMPSCEILPGFALDLTTTDAQGIPWDFDLPERRAEARRLVEKEQPMFLIGSPMCTAFSSWQRLNELKRDPEVVRREYVKAMVHLQFVC